jgi:hypothetical protein
MDGAGMAAMDSRERAAQAINVAGSRHTQSRDHHFSQPIL